MAIQLVEFTMANPAVVISINPNMVQYVRPNGDNTSIILSSGAQIIVAMTYADVLIALTVV